MESKFYDIEFKEKGYPWKMAENMYSNLFRTVNLSSIRWKKVKVRLLPRKSLGEDRRQILLPLGKSTCS